MTEIEHTEERVRRLREEGRLDELQEALRELSDLQLGDGSKSAAIRTAEERVEVCRELGEPLLVAEALEQQGAAELKRNPMSAIDPLEEALAIYRSERPGVDPERCQALLAEARDTTKSGLQGCAMVLAPILVVVLLAVLGLWKVALVLAAILAAVALYVWRS